MKKLTIITLLSIFTFIEVSAIGLDSKAMAMRTSYLKLSAITEMKELPLGLKADSKYAIAAEVDYAQQIQRFALLLAINFTVWDKYSIDVNFGSRISTLIPLLLIAQLPISRLGVNASSLFMRNFIVGMWLGYYMNGFKDSDVSITYKTKFSVLMVGLMATLYLNELLAFQKSAVLFYITMKMGMIFEKNTFEFDDQKDSESWTKFGVFPAVGAEYFIAPSLAIFMALGYNPYGWAEFGIRLSLGK